MGQEDLLELRRGKTLHQSGRVRVREVSARTPDALLEALRPLRVVQHHGIVIGLHRRHVRFRQLESDGIDRGADIGTVEIGTAVCLDEITDGIRGIMRNREGADGERPDLEFLSDLERIEVLFANPHPMGDRLGRHQRRSQLRLGIVLVERLEAAT